MILDLDNSGLEYAERIARMVMHEWPRVGDCLILESTTQPDRVRLSYNKWGRPLVIHDRPNHHLVYGGLIGYNTAAKICRTLAGLGVLEEDYDKIREFRGDMTLRVSPSSMMDEVKPEPRAVLYLLNDNADWSDIYIKEYLKFKKIGELLFLGVSHSKGIPDDCPNDPDGRRK